MPFLFESNDVHNLLDNKRLVLMGCSNVRAIYKDLICLHQYNEFISNEILRQKMENSCFGDNLVKHGIKHNGRDYLEERLYRKDGTSVSFYFLTKIYSGYVERILADMTIDSAPDVIIASSCLWDITRWGPNGVEEYKANLNLFFGHLNRILPSTSLVIWLTAAPLAQDVRGGFLIPQLDFLKYSLRFHVLEANAFCRKTADRYGIDVIDIHYHLRMFLEYRAEDGIHWLPKGVRLCTNLVLTHIALSWGSNGSPCDSFLVDSEKKLIEDERRHFRCIPDEEIPSQTCRSEEQPLTTADRWDEEFITYGNNDVNEAPPSQRPKAQRGNWRARRYFRPRKNWWRRTWLRGKHHAAAKASRAQQSE
ncbi:PC-esterase domain-containing protein 1A [Rhipicephalus microplus]|uniref:PC-esterase domain-containing protein 1A n=1 Tax=Rhipicephalus microplus TaxID=6941 RepID=UPI003F6ACA0D